MTRSSLRILCSVQGKGLGVLMSTCGIYLLYHISSRLCDTTGRKSRNVYVVANSLVISLETFVSRVRFGVRGLEADMCRFVTRGLRSLTTRWIAMGAPCFGLLVGVTLDAPAFDEFMVPPTKSGEGVREEGWWR